MSRFKDYFKVIETTKPIDEEGKYGLEVQIDYAQVKPLDFNDLDLEPKESITEHLRRQYKQKTDIDISALVVMEALEKAKQYDKLSNELGCPLEVVFKALKEGCHIKDEGYFECPDIYFHSLEMEFVIGWANKDNMGYELLKDYGKTWWLKGEKKHEED